MKLSLKAAQGALLAAAFGCGPSSRVTLPKQHASMFGHEDVTFLGDFSKLGDINSVVVGGIHAYNLRPTQGALTVTLQGHGTPGVVDVQVIGASGQLTLPSAIEYDPAVAGVPLKWVAFGASLSQGFQSDGLNPYVQTHGFAAQVASAARIYLGIPLFTPTFVPALQPADMNPDCTQKPNTGPDEQSIVGTITVRGTGQIDLRRARVDPTLVAQNIAIGGETLDELVHGTTFGQAIIERTVEEPDSPSGDIFSPLPFSQLDRLVALDPDVGISLDLLANDTDGAVTSGPALHPEYITPVATAMPLLQVIAHRLGGLHGQFFIANMPSLTFLPNVVQMGQAAAMNGTQAAFNAAVAQTQQLTDALNQALAQAIAQYPNLHLVDFEGGIEGVVTSGVNVGHETLFPTEFGGLLSLDDLHLTTTGYAVTANIFINAINAVLKTSIPLVDVAAVAATDPLSIDTLRADGFTCIPPE